MPGIDWYCRIVLSYETEFSNLAWYGGMPHTTARKELKAIYVVSSDSFAYKRIELQSSGRKSLLEGRESEI